MKGQLRKSGIDIIGDIPWGTHFCQFYQTKEDLMDILVPYFKAGLENNEFCIWITSQPLDAEEAKEALRKAVSDIDAYLEKGQIEIIPYNYWYVKDGRSGSEKDGLDLGEGLFDSDRVLNCWVEKLNHALARGYEGMRLSGNTFWLEKEGWNDFIEYEEEIDNVIGNFNMIALCTYSLDRCNATEIIDVAINHQFALIKRNGKWEQLESSSRKRAGKEAAQAAKDWEYTFDAIPDLIAILDDQYRIIRANRAMASRLNVRPEECAGLICYKAVHGTEEPPSFCPNRQLLKDGNEHTSEVYEDCFGGYFLVSVSALHNSDGKLIGSVHVARDINERKQAEDALRQSEQHVRLKLEKILSPVSGTDTFELAEIVDIPVIQSLINDFYKLTHVPVSLNDLKCNFLASAGWQDICARFHRVHPKTCRHCVESDIELSSCVSPREFKMYRCKNNMWDIVTPIMVSGRQVGYIFAGQFFFEDETLDYELFRSQARKYGFNEEEYISALEKVPRLNRETVDAGMAFLVGFANILSQLSYSNIKLAQSLAERDTLVYALRESDERFHSVLDNSLDSAYRMDFHNNCFDYMSPVIEQITGFSVKEIDAMTNGLIDRIHPDDHQLVMVGSAQSLDKGFGAHEYRFKCKDGKYRWLADHFSIIKDKTGMTRYRAGIVRDITEKKQAEEALIRSENKFRTLAENSTDVIVRFDRQNRHIYANPAAEEPYSRPPEEIIGKTHCELGMDPEKAKFWEKHHENVFATGKPETIEFQYTAPQGKEYYFNTRIIPEFIDGKVTYVLSISRDITEIKEAEDKLKETLNNLENLVEERTVQLEKAYNSLKESEMGLAEAQKIAHIGNWEWDFTTDKVYWSEEMYRIFGRDPQELAPSCNEFLNYLHPDDRDCMGNVTKKDMNRKTYSTDYRIIRADGEEHIVNIQSKIVFNEKNIPVRMKGTIQDITERKKAEELLKESEGRLKALFKLLPIGISIIDKKRNVLDVNLALERIMGLSRSDILKGDHRVRKYLRSNGAEMSYEDLPSARALKEKGSIHSSEVGMVRDDGSVIWADVSAISLPLSDDQVVITVRDITENKKAEEKLLTLANALESSDDAILTRSLDGIIMSWNKGAEQIYGYLTEEVLGKNISILEPETLKGEIKQLDEKIKQGERIRHYETLRLKKDGTVINISITLSPVFNASGMLVAISTVSRDITERKRAEEALIRSENKFRTLAENSPDLIARLDRKTRHLYGNPAYLEMYNISQEDLIGKTNDELGMDPEKVKFWDRHYENIFATGKPETIEFHHTSPQGKECYFNTRIVPEFVDGEVTSVLSISRDITERKMTEEAMEKMDKIRIKEIHHRIKNNLQVISSLLSLEAERFSDAKMLEAFRESQGRVTSMALIHEELYKGDEIETLDFAAYLRKLTSNLFGSYNLRKDNVSVRLDLEQVYLEMDIAIPLGIIVNELVSNALKHAFPAGGRGEIHITLCKTGALAGIYDTHYTNPHYMEKSGPHYILTVSDNGKGIPEEIEFQNADSLGLQLVNILVEQIDGCIELKKNSGTEFTIWFSSLDT